MNHPIKDCLRYLLAFVPVLAICLVSVNLFHTEQVSARWIDDVGKDYVVYRKGSTVLYWNSKNSGWSILPAIPQIKLNGSACGTDDDTRDFDSSKTFYNCKGLTISASTQSTWFKEARLAYQIGDFDSRETISVKGGYIAKYGVSTNPPISSDEKSAIAYKGVKFDTNNNGKTDLDCNSPNPNKSNGCSLLLVFDYAHGNEFEIDLNNKWNSDGTASSGHEFWYTSPATNEYQTLTFNPNGGSVVDDEVQTDGTVGDENTLWSHRSADDQKVIREYVKGDTANEYPTPTWTDHTFLGWYTKASGGRLSCSAPINPNCSRPMNSDLTLYAHWGDTPILKQLTCSAVFTSGTLLVGDAGTLNLTSTASLSPVTKISGSITGPSANQPFTVNASSGTVSFTPAASGTFTATAIASDSSGATSPQCTTTIQAGYRPYFEVKGGDILAFVSAGELQPKGIISWNSNGAGYQGAASQLAAVTNGDILSYVTGSANTTGAAPSRLAFANSAGTTNGTDKWGGSLDQNAVPSRKVYYDEAHIQALASVLTYNGGSLTGKGTGVYRVANDVTITGSMLSLGQKITLVVDPGKNVFISGDITYSYASIDAIPRLTIYTSGDNGAGGNIIVSGGVHTITGVFDIENDGIFYSCGLSASDPIDPTYAATNPGTYYDDCRSQLTVRGMVSADKIVLMRTLGSWNDVGKGAAEIFVQSPETWLNGSGSGKFDSYVSLPPIL